MIEDEIDIYLEQQDELYKEMIVGLDYEWSKKPIWEKAIIKIRSFIELMIFRIQEKLKDEELPF